MINSRNTKQLSNAGKYNKLLLFEEHKEVQTVEGHMTEKWVKSDLDSVFVQIRNIRGNEFILAGANQVKVSARINMRYRKDIEDKYYELGEKLRLNLKKQGRPDRIFEIEYINNLEERNIELEILVNEVR